MKHKISNLASFIFLISLLYIGHYVYRYFLNPAHFPINKVEIHIAKGMTEQTSITQAISSELAKGFFAVNINTVRQQLLALPWIAEVSVTRFWPDRVVLELKEYLGVALWNTNGMIDASGYVFYPDLKKISNQLPTFIGPIQYATQMSDEYKFIMQQLALTGQNVHTLNLNSQGAWCIILDSGLKLILGKTDLHTRFERFTKTYRKNLQRLLPFLDYIDLRYTNGYALGWKRGIDRPIISGVAE